MIKLINLRVKASNSYIKTYQKQSNNLHHKIVEIREDFMTFPRMLMTLTKLIDFNYYLISYAK